MSWSRRAHTVFRRSRAVAPPGHGITLAPPPRYPVTRPHWPGRRAGLHDGPDAREAEVGPGRRASPQTPRQPPDDGVALRTLTALYDLGLGAPGGLAVIGFDDTEYGALTTPALTTVHIDAEAHGRQAARAVARPGTRRPPARPGTSSSATQHDRRAEKRISACLPGHRVNLRKASGLPATFYIFRPRETRETIGAALFSGLRHQQECPAELLPAGYPRLISSMRLRGLSSAGQKGPDR